MMKLNVPNGSRLPEDFPINLNDPQTNVKHFTRLMGDSNPEVETVSYYGGHMFATNQNEKMIPLLGIEGIGVTRFETQDDGSVQVFHREIGYYSDVRTGEYVDTWTNPLGGKVEVYHILNKQVNNKMAAINEMDFDGTVIKVPFPALWDIIGATTVNNFELHLDYPTFMDKNKWKREYPGKKTKISEMFMRQFETADLLDEKQTSIHHQGSWARTSTWFPWMLMGEASGEVVFRTHGMKLRNGIDDIPKQLRDKIEKEHPDHFVAPPASSWGKPNESSFTNFLRDRQPAAGENNYPESGPFSLPG